MTWLRRLLARIRHPRNPMLADKNYAATFWLEDWERARHGHPARWQRKRRELIHDALRRAVSQ